VTFVSFFCRVFFLLLRKRVKKSKLDPLPRKASYCRVCFLLLRDVATKSKLDPLPRRASCCRHVFPVATRRAVATTVKIGSVTSESFLLPRVFPVATRCAVATKVKIGSVTSESFLLPRVFPVATRRAVATARSEKPTSRPDLVHYCSLRYISKAFPLREFLTDLNGTVSHDYFHWVFIMKSYEKFLSQFSDFCIGVIGCQFLWKIR
jgi:hypothetical protein